MNLGRKKNIDNSLWIEAFENIEKTVQPGEIDVLEKQTVQKIQETVAGKNVAYGWSGGKDSIVLGKLCENAGIHACMFAHTNLEYPEFLKWCLDNKPIGCEVINVGFDLKWLADHPKMLFPQNCKIAYRWFQIVQQSAIRQYFRRHHLDMMVVGHRTADGNYVGKGSNISKNGAGVVRYSPIVDWTHEQVLAYIHYRGLQLPPIYDWKDGYKCGTHPWPARQHTKSIEDGFRTVYKIDKSIIESAADYIHEARHFLEKEVTK